MKLLEDNKGLLTPPSESDKMYNPTLPTPSLTKAGNGDESNGAAGKSFPRSKSYQNETSETLELNNGDIIYLDFLEEGHSSFVLEGINKLRKQGQFCDIILVVEDHEIQAHRAVLAACSPFLFDFFSGLEETTEPLPTYKLKHVHYNGFQYLLDYMYTGRLHVPLENVPAVYATSLNLKMETATKICAGFLANHLTTANCLGIRAYLFVTLLRIIIWGLEMHITIAVCVLENSLWLSFVCTCSVHSLNVIMYYDTFSFCHPTTLPIRCIL